MAGETDEKAEVKELLLNMGPQHPSTHGVLRLVVGLDGEKVVSTTPDIGYLHRGIEKIATQRTWLQLTPYLDRLDYVSGILNEWAYVLAVEELADIRPPQRAEFIRVIAGELSRIASHFLSTSTYLMELGAVTPMFVGMLHREGALDLLEELTGARLTFNFMRFGGVKADLPPGFDVRCRELADHLRPMIDELEDLITGNEIFLMRTRNVGCISQELVKQYGLSGPIARGSGLSFDLRRALPYSVYPQFEFDVPTGRLGDCYDRYKVKIEEMRQSLRILEQAVGGLPAGRFRSFIPALIRPPRGTAYRAVEGARGEMGCFIASDGSACPLRVKFREPSFAGVQALKEVLPGNMLADAVAVCTSMDYVMGGVDR